jgi:raffinose/stachyose/melibiose transport system substrate-binding protein
LAAFGLAAGLTACGTSDTPAGDDATTDGGGDATQTLIWWHNMNADPGLAYWKSVVADYEADHPGLKIDMQVYQNEDLRTKIRTALQSDNAPDLFQQWGGGELIDQVQAGYVMDLSDQVADEIAVIGEGNVVGWQVDGKTYGLPFTLGIEGIWYNKDMFETAGITSAPKTLDDLSAAVEKLKAAGLQPIAVGGQDGWPAAHWYFNFALRECSQATLVADATDKAFTDPCWQKAAQDLADFAATDPFNDGWVTTSAQVGAGSSAGMLANGQAAMELMGIWESGVVGSLAPDQKVPEFLGWFPFPSVPGGGGDQKAAMAGGDGFSCHKDAPASCVEFLKYILSDKVQAGYAATGSVPANPNANSSLTEPILQDVTAQAKDVSYTQLWLDTVYGANVGTAINNNVVALLQGQYQPGAFVQAVQEAAAKS